MYKNCTLKPVVIIVALSITLIFGVLSSGHTGGPQPGPKEEGGPLFVGKSVDGFLTAVIVDQNAIGADIVLGEDDPAFIVQHIVVTCKDADVVLGPAINFPSPDQSSLEQTMAECVDEGELCIEGLAFEAALIRYPDLRGCFPGEDSDFTDVFITRVKNFINTGTAISAEVTLRLGQQQ